MINDSKTHQIANESFLISTDMDLLVGKKASAFYFNRLKRKRKGNDGKIGFFRQVLSPTPANGGTSF